MCDENLKEENTKLKSIIAELSEDLKIAIELVKELENKQ